MIETRTPAAEVEQDPHLPREWSLSAHPAVEVGIVHATTPHRLNSMKELTQPCVLTTAVGIDAGAETNVRAVVRTDDRAGRVFEKTGRRSRVVVVPVFPLIEKLLEPVSRILLPATRA